jgi:hypothetical protein
VDPQPHRNGIHDVEGAVNAPVVFVKTGVNALLFVKTGVNALLCALAAEASGTLLKT